MNSKLVISSLAFYMFFNGGIMAHQPSKHWFKLIDTPVGAAAEFPGSPISMHFDLPFSNTQAKEKLSSYTFSDQKDCFFLTSYQSPDVNEILLNEKNIQQFFKTILIPHLFYYPQVTSKEMTFKVDQKHLNHQVMASITIEYSQGEDVQKIEGRACVKDNTLYTYFYLAPQNAFNPERAGKFLNSFSLID